MKKLRVTSIAFATSLCLIGCGGNDQSDVGNNKNAYQVNPVDVNYIPKNVSNQSTNNTERTLTISEHAEQQIEQMDEIETARVIIFNNQAYVALRMHHSNHISNDRHEKDRNFENRNKENDGNVKHDRNLVNVKDDERNYKNRSYYAGVFNAFEQDIANIIRKTEAGVRSVNISADPDTFNRMNAFSDTLKMSGTSDSLVAEFNEMVYVFFGS